MKFIFTILVAFTTCTMNAQSSNIAWDWSITGNSSADNKAEGICADRTGTNAFIYGSFSDTLILNDDTLIPFPNVMYNIYLIKYNQVGEMVWSTNLGSDLNLSIGDITSDYNGDIILMGNFRGKIYMENDTIEKVNPSQDNTFAMKFSGITGDLLWERDMANSAFSPDNMALCNDAQNNVYMVGDFQTSYTIDTVTVTGYNQGMFLIKLNSAGSALWGKATEFNNFSFPYGPTGIWVDSTGNCYMTGTLASTTDFGNGVILNSAMNLDNSFLVKFNSQGVAQWAKIIDGFNQGYYVRGDNNGSVYCAGWFNQFIPNSVDTFNIVSPTNESMNGDIYLCKFNSTTGQPQWVSSFGSDGLEFMIKLAIDTVGNVYVLGTYGDTLVVGGDTLIADPNPDLLNLNTFLAKIEENGNPVSLERIGLLGAIDVTDEGSVFFAGVDSVNASRSMVSTSFVAQKSPGVITNVKAGSNKLSDVLIYPNPSDGYFILQLNSEKNTDVTLNIYSTEGRFIQSVTANLSEGVNNKSFDFSHLSSGIYFMQMVDSKGVSVLRFVVD